MSVVHDNVTNTGNSLAMAAQEFHDAADNLGKAKNRFDTAKDALAEADGNMANYIEEVKSEGFTYCREEAAE